MLRYSRYGLYWGYCICFSYVVKFDLVKFFFFGFLNLSFDFVLVGKLKEWEYYYKFIWLVVIFLVLFSWGVEMSLNVF